MIANDDGISEIPAKTSGRFFIRQNAEVGSARRDIINSLSFAVTPMNPRFLREVSCDFRALRCVHMIRDYVVSIYIYRHDTNACAYALLSRGSFASVSRSLSALTLASMNARRSYIISHCKCGNYMI